MRRAREVAQIVPSPEEHLRRALSARSSATRAKYAQLGLATKSRMDRTTQAMLLRQLYLAHYEGRKFDEARCIATQMITLDVLPDVAHQDAARACQALGDFERAVGHLRLAARKAPASRRAFHWWSLGSLLYLIGRYDEAAAALARAARWGTTDKPLFLAHQALARCAAGDRARGLDTIIERLAAAPCGEGYGRFVLGELCRHAGRRDDAIRHLSAFLRRTTSRRVAVAIALGPEVEEAKRSLSRLRSN